jgi:hypothetical protein
MMTYSPICRHNPIVYEFRKCHKTNLFDTKRRVNKENLLAQTTHGINKNLRNFFNSINLNNLQCQDYKLSVTKISFSATNMSKQDSMLYVWITN